MSRRDRIFPPPPPPHRFFHRCGKKIHSLRRERNAPSSDLFLAVIYFEGRGGRERESYAMKNTGEGGEDVFVTHARLLSSRDSRFLFDEKIRDTRSRSMFYNLSKEKKGEEGLG